MAIHASQGRRSGGSKKNSRRGYGKVFGAASNGGGSEAKTATNHAPQGARSAGGVRKGVVKELDGYSKASPFNAIAAGIASSPKAVADLSGRRKAQSEGNSKGTKPPEDKMLSFGYKDIGNNSKLTDSLKQQPQVSKLANYNDFNRWGAKGAVDNMILDIDANLRSELRSGVTKGGLVAPRIAKKPDPASVAKTEPKEKPGGLFSVPPEKVDAKPAPVVSNKEMPAIPADAAEKGAEKAKEQKPRPTTWANGTPVGSGTDKTKIHPDSLAARGKPGGERKGDNHAANEAKQNQEGAVAPKEPKVPGRSADTGGGKVSSSVTLDHSAADEARDRRAKLTAAHGAAAASAFEGDIGKTMQAGSLIRSLQQQAREAEAVGPRIRSSQSSVTRPNRKFVIGDS